MKFLWIRISISKYYGKILLNFRDRKCILVDNPIGEMTNNHPTCFKIFNVYHTLDIKEFINFCYYTNHLNSCFSQIIIIPMRSAVIILNFKLQISNLLITYINMKELFKLQTKNLLILY